LALRFWTHAAYDDFHEPTGNKTCAPIPHCAFDGIEQERLSITSCRLHHR